MSEDRNIPAPKPDFDSAASGEESKVVSFPRVNQPAQQQAQAGCPLQALKKLQAALQRG